MKSTWKTMENQLLEELERVLAFWERQSWDGERGIFLTLGCDNKPLPDGRRSAVLIARVLWAYAAAARLTGKEHYAAMAGRAYADMKEHYLDKEYGGIYELLEADGSVRSGSKSTYAQSYAVYALAEYAQAADCPEALDTAWEIYERIERYAYDPAANGYHSACSRQWEPQPDVFTLNSHLHLMESYTTLHKARPSETLRESLKRLVGIITGRYLRENGALYQLLALDWQPTEDLSDRFGDESECCWMLVEAAGQIGEAAWDARVRDAVARMSGNILDVGYDKAHGGVFDRLNSDGSMSTDKLWWEESETVTALLYAYRLFGGERCARAAAETWDFIRTYVCDRESEWRWMVRAGGEAIPVSDPYSPLKCPYHSSRVMVLCVPVLRELSGQ